MQQVLRRRKSIPALTGFRAVAAYLVFLHHHGPGANMIGNIAMVINQGYIGVSMFFVLSGFLIYYNYADQVSFKISWFLSYFRNRIVRIYPLFFIIAVLNMWLIGERSPEIWVFNLTFLSGFTEPWSSTWRLPQAWSLPVEECFYILAPFIFFLRRKRNVSLVVMTLVFYGLGYLTYLAFFPWVETSTSLWYFRFHTFFGRAGDFLIGVYVAELYMNGKLSFGRFKLSYWGAAGILLSLFLLAMFGGNTTELGLAVSMWFVPPATGLFIYGLATEDTYIGRILATRVSVFLGRASFAFYLLQQGVFHSFLIIEGWRDILSRFLAIQIVAALAFTLVEDPIHRLLRSKSKV